MCTVGAYKCRHVLDHTKDWDINSAEHTDPLDSIFERQVLWSRYYDRAYADHVSSDRITCHEMHKGSMGKLLTVQVDLLCNGQLGVPCPRRKIEHQDVQSAPIHIMKELLHGLHHHEAAPNDRRLVGHEVAHRHGLDAIVGEGDKLVVCVYKMLNKKKESYTFR